MMYRIRADRPLAWKTTRNSVGKCLRLQLFVSGLVVCTVATLGCGSRSSSQPSATISATPNPVPAGNGPGTTTISWNIPDGSKGQVYVCANGRQEKLFAGLSSHGSSEINWIGPSTYEFRLYAGSNKERLLASVAVTQVKGGAAKPPSTAPIETNGESP